MERVRESCKGTVRGACAGHENTEKNKKTIHYTARDAGDRSGGGDDQSQIMISKTVTTITFRRVAPASQKLFSFHADHHGRLMSFCLMTILSTSPRSQRYDAGT